MTVEQIRSAIREMVGAVENEPAQTAIGRFIRDEDVSLADLAADLDRADGAADLAAAVRKLAA